MKKLEYQVIEDNGGGLHVFVWTDGILAIGMYDLEWLTRKNFADTLASLKSGELDIDTITRWWDGVYHDPQKAHDELTAHEFGWCSIAEYKKDQLYTYPERMGRAGKIAFGLEDE